MCLDLSQSRLSTRPSFQLFEDALPAAMLRKPEGYFDAILFGHGGTLGTLSFSEMAAVSRATEVLSAVLQRCCQPCCRGAVSRATEVLSAVIQRCCQPCYRGAVSRATDVLSAVLH
eukprot:gene15631-biopygen9692